MKAWFIIESAEGRRHVTGKEREIAQRIKARCDYALLPWYKKLITRKPQ